LFLELLPNYKILALPGLELFGPVGLILFILMLPPGFPDSGRLFLDGLSNSNCCYSGV